MTAARRDIEIEVGASSAKTFVITNQATGLPWAIAGWGARMQVRKTTLDAVTLLDLSVANGAITIDGPAGQFTVHLTAVQTAALGAAARQGVYDIWLDPTGVSSESSVRIVYGDVKITTPVTR